LSTLPLLYKYHEFYNKLYYIFVFANPGEGEKFGIRVGRGERLRLGRRKGGGLIVSEHYDSFK